VFVSAIQPRGFFICKFDIDAAYRRCSFSSRTAFESLMIFAGFLLVALRMTFGGAPCPSIWGVISETITDIGNSLLQNKFWIHSDLFDPISDQIDVPLSLPDSVPFHQSRELSVKVPDNDKGKVDIYIDDSIGVAPDIADAPSRVIRAIPLAIRTLARPNSDTDVIPRKDINSSPAYFVTKPQSDGLVTGYRFYSSCEESSLQTIGFYSRKTESCGLYFTPYAPFYGTPVQGSF